MWKLPIIESLRSVFDLHGGITVAQRRAKSLDAVLLVTALATFLLTLENMLGLVLRQSSAMTLYLAQDLAALFMLGLIATMHRRGHPRPAALFFVLCAVIGATALFASQGSDRVLLIYTIPVIAASFLLHPSATLGTSLFALLCYSLARSLAGLPNDLGMIQLSAFGILASTVWLIASLFERSLDLVHTSERRFRSLVQDVTEGIAQIDPAGRFVFANPMTARIFGVAPEELLTRQLADYVIPEHQSLLAHQYELQRAGKRSTFELAITRADGLCRTVGITATPQTDHTGKFIGSLGSIRDITERQQIQDQLIASERLAQATLAALPEEICVLDETGTIIKTNRAWLKFAAANVNTPNQDFIGTNYLAVCDNAQGPNSTQAAPFAEGIRAVLRDEIEQFALEYPCNSANEERWFVGRVTRFPGEGPLRLVVSHENISERKRAEQALRASEAKYRRMFDEAAFGIFHSTPAGRFLDVNPALARMLGYASPQEVVDAIHSIPDQIYADKPRHSAVLESTLANKVIRTENRYRRKDGSIWDAKLTVSQIAGAQGEIILEGYIEDITERKRAEQELATSEQRFRALVENISDGIELVNAAGVVTFASPSVRRILGIAPEQALGAGIGDLHPDDQASAHATMAQVLASPGTSIAQRYRLKHHDGTWRWFEGSATNLLHDSAIGAIVVDFRDVTERTLAEHNLELLAQASRELGTALDLQTIYTTLTQAIQQAMPCDSLFVANYTAEDQLIRCAYGYGPQGILDVSAFPPIPLEEQGHGTQSLVIRSGEALLLNDYVTLLKTATTTYHVGTGGTLEREIPEDEERPRSALIVPLKRKGTVSGTLQVFSLRLNAFVPRDLQFLESLALHVSTALANAHLFAQLENELTERKRAEESLRESEEQFRLLFNNVGDGIGRVNEPGNFLIANPALENIFGVAPGGLIGRDITEFIPATHRIIHNDQVAQRRTGTRSRYELEITRADGTPHTVVVTATPWFDQTGRYAGAFGVFHDITEQKLRDQENQKLVALIESSPDLIGLASLDGQVQYLNQGGRALVGLGSADVTQLHISEFVPANSATFEKAMQTMATQHYWQGEGELINFQTGNHLPVHVQTFIIPHPQTHQPMALGTVMQDIAERKRAEAEIARHADQIATLNEAALGIQGTLEPKQIYRIACQELKKFGSLASVFSLSPDGWLTHCATALSEPLKQNFLAQFDAQPFHLTVSLAELPAEFQHVFADGAILPPHHARQVLDQIGTRAAALGDWMQAHLSAMPLLLAPLTRGNMAIGVFGVMGKTLTQADLPAVMLFARQVSVALENARLFAAEQARRIELGASYNLANSLVATDSLDETLRLIAEHAVTSTHVTFARIALLEHDQFVVRAAHPVRLLTTDLYAPCQLSTQQHDFCKQLLNQTDPVTLFAGDHSLTRNDRQAFFLGIAKSACVVPLRASDTAIGLLILGEERAPNREPFDPAKRRLARAIGDQAASAIHRAQLHTQTQHNAIQLANAYDATIEGWSRALDLRDNETEGHTQRVTEVTLQLARLFGIPNHQLIHIRRGALLHDIGKMGVPDAILLKPGTLNDQEWEIMRRHPDYAQMVLAPIHYLAPALDIPYCHHEKWDGSGYPRGLAGEAIPLVARLFAIVDVWDALTSNRPYRAGLPKARALEYIRAQSGTHFDPQVVAAFLKMLETMPNTQ